MHKLVLMRHGESQWNLENRFTGWTDVDLTETGREQARKAGELLKKEGYTFDLAYSSLLKRAIRTLWIALDAMDAMYTPVGVNWRLNERHYGALQGLNKAETAAQYGDEQVLIWRRAYAIAPEPLSLDDKRHPRFDSRYAKIPADQLPATECLKDVVARSSRANLLHGHVLHRVGVGECPPESGGRVRFARLEDVSQVLRIGIEPCDGDADVAMQHVARLDFGISDY